MKPDTLYWVFSFSVLYKVSLGINFYKMKIVLQIFLCCILVISCKTDPTKGLQDLDLMSKGLPIKIKAPLDAEIVSNNMGVVKDVTVQRGDDFYIQIMGSDAITFDKVKLLSEQKELVESGPFFSKIVEESENGFIFEKKIDENNINYDFRVVKIQGDQEYVFQTGLIGRFTEEQARKMYQAVQ